jgi:hypothetical protein
VILSRLNTTEYFFRERRYQFLVTLLCIVCGTIFILNIHPIGDGLWFWYAILMRGGRRLYADMHLPLQPLFVLLTAWTQEILGKGWLASKTLALTELILFSIALFQISNSIRWKDWQKAVLIAAAFGMTITPIYIRFDDYHIVGYCCELYSIYLLLRLKDEVSLRSTILAAALMGMLSGLSTSNRLNDGAMLFVACAFVLPFFVPRKKILITGIFSFVALLTLVGIIRLTGDSLHDWALNSIVRAAAIKGGSTHVLYVPFKFPVVIGRYIRHERGGFAILLYEGVAAAFCAWISGRFRKPDGRTQVKSVAVGSSFLFLTLPLLFSHTLKSNVPNISVAAFVALLYYVLVLLVFARLFRSLFTCRPNGVRRLELILLVPFLQLISAAMTSSGLSYQIACHPAGIFLLLLPISLPILFEKEWQKSVWVTIAGFAVISTLIAKVPQPYHWHHYSSRTPFVQREWYDHPVYGPMYIERDQLRFIRSICSNISEDDPSRELLSLPYPYPNYFCNVPPWHGYVQTWYDTSSKETINTLIGELQTAPPQWIIYQRGLDTMVAHELVFTDGHPLPHRALDWLIMDRIIEGRWVVVRREVFQDADWILIRTRP